MNRCRSDGGKQPRVIRCSKSKYGLCRKKFALLLRKIVTARRPLTALVFNASPVEDSPWRARTASPASDFHFGVSGSHGYTSQPLKPPMWRNGRRNGLKIAVLAISALCTADQIDPNLPG